MAWDVMSGVTKTAWDVLSAVANLCGMFCPGMFCRAPIIFTSDENLNFYFILSVCLFV